MRYKQKGKNQYDAEGTAWDIFIVKVAENLPLIISIVATTLVICITKDLKLSLLPQSLNIPSIFSFWKK